MKPVIEKKEREEKEIVKLASYSGITTLKNVTISRVDTDFGGSFALWYDGKISFVNAGSIFGQELDGVFDKIGKSIFNLSFASFQGNYQGRAYTGYHIISIVKVSDRVLTDEEKASLKERSQMKLSGF